MSESAIKEVNIEDLADFDSEELLDELRGRGVYIIGDLSEFDDDDLIEELRSRDSYSDDENLSAILNSLKLNQEEKALQLMRTFLSDKYGVIL
jgi:hypothetical protein